jgi:hypothetical protein
MFYSEQNRSDLQVQIFQYYIRLLFSRGKNVFFSFAKLSIKMFLSLNIFRSIYHYQQKSNWDCGLSCVFMALSEVDDCTREEIISNSAEICRKEGFGHSTWTIDLCYLLKVGNEYWF